MKTTIDKEFFERWKYKDVAMWCKKKEYAEEFCKLMHEQGLRWSTRHSYLEHDYWEVEKNNIIYLFNIGAFGNKTSAVAYLEDCAILDFEDYIVEEKINKVLLEELQE